MSSFPGTRTHSGTQAFRLRCLISRNDAPLTSQHWHLFRRHQSPIPASCLLVNTSPAPLFTSLLKSYNHSLSGTFLPLCVPNQNLSFFWNLVYKSLAFLTPSIFHPLQCTHYQALCKHIGPRQSYKSRPSSPFLLYLVGSASVYFGKNHLLILFPLLSMLKYYLAHTPSTWYGLWTLSK